MRFRATVQLDGKTATGIHVPEKIVAALGGSKRPRVRVTLAGHTYQTTVARMRGEFMFPVNAAVREQTGLAAGDKVDVTIEPDTEPRELSVPTDFSNALKRSPAALGAFEKLSYSNRKRHILSIEGAKTEETRQRRIAKALSELTATDG